MQADTLSPRIESAQIDTFTAKLRDRVAIRTGVTWADEPEEDRRVLGFHPLVWIIPACLAAVLMLIDAIGAAF